MFPGSFDPNSLILLLVGKDHPWFPLIILFVVIIQKWNDIKRLYYKSCLFGKTQYKISGSILNNIDENYIYGQLSKSMWATILYINKIVKNDKSLLSNANSFRLPANELFDYNELIVIPASNTVINLTSDIQCRINIKYTSRDTSRSDKMCAIDITTLEFVLSTNNPFDSIMKFMNLIQGEYIEQLNKKSNSQLCIYKPTFSDREVSPDGEYMNYPIGIPFKSIKSFDNLFFEGKEALIKRLDAFVNRQKYKVLGLPETLGLLFHGEPGTGKTSCIKAIANYLNMNLIIVPMNQIRSKKRLEEVFFSTKYNIEQDRRIYVFEEIDCNGWENIVKDRRLLKGADDAEPETNILEQLADTLIIDKAKDKKTKKDDKDDKLTLGAILEIIDGLVECPGRVIIMTTNHKDSLDSALLRPGRIDMQIEFKRLRNIDIADIFTKWYGHNLCQEDICKIPNYKYTQAEISQLLFKYENNSVGFIAELCG